MKNTSDLERGIALLGRTPAVLAAWLGGLDDALLRRNEGGETWSPFDVVGHLIHGDQSDWMTRARTILDHGEARPFEPFDRFAQVREPKAATMDEQLSMFSALRARNLASLKELGLTDADFARTGSHPALGVVTLGDLLSTWVAHDLVHIRQIARLLAEEQRGEVGPWIEYLPLLA